MLESGLRYRAGLVVRALGRNLFRRWAPRDDGYGFVASGDPATDWPNTLLPGGLSNYWTGAVPRFTPEDFVEGARLHERYRWPLGYSDLVPYYSYAEQLLGIVAERRATLNTAAPESIAQVRELPEPWRRVAETAETLGRGLWYAPIADGPDFLIRRAGAAFNSYEQLVGRFGRFPHFELRLGAHAQKLTWNTALGRVDGVDYLDRAANTRRHINAAAVILAAGPLASPKLLLQSTSADFPLGLGNNHGLVGGFLHDHPKAWSVIELERALPRLDQPLHLTRASYADSEPLHGALMTIGPLSKWDRVLSLVAGKTRQFGLTTFTTMLPEESNRISLHPDLQDRFGMPLLDIHIQYRTDVADTVAATHAAFRNILDRAGIRSRLDYSQARLVPGWSAHYGGAARMHASPDYGVVDGWSRIHEANNVAVVDASVFTTAVEKNPTLTVMALAARSAGKLAEDLVGTATQSEEGPHAVPAVR
jgi:choline dehydrogenase-like flavoprotein